MFTIIALLAVAGAVTGTVVAVTSPSRKLDEADKLAKEGKIGEAERLYLSIWAKHKSAPAHLAQAYLKQAEKEHGTEYIKKALALPETDLGEDAVSGLHDAKKNVIKYADEYAENAFDKGNLSEAVSYAETIASIAPRFKTKALRYRIYDKSLSLLAGRISAESLRTEITKGGKKAIDYTYEVAEKLHGSKRFQDAARLLVFIAEDERAKRLNEKNTIASIRENGGFVHVDGKAASGQITYAESYADGVEDDNWGLRIRIYQAIQRERPSERVAKKIEKTYRDAATKALSLGQLAKAYEISSASRDLSPALSRVFLDSALALAQTGALRKPDGILEEIEKQPDPLSEMVKFIDYFPSLLRPPFITRTADKIISTFDTDQKAAIATFNGQRDFHIKSELLNAFARKAPTVFRAMVSQALENPKLFPGKDSAACKQWIETVGGFSDKDFAVPCLKGLLQKGYPAEKAYIDNLLQLLDAIPDVDAQLTILNDALTVSRSSRLVERKERIAEAMTSSAPERALILCDELEGLTATGILRQKAYYRLAVKSEDLDKKLDYLRKSLNTSGRDAVVVRQVYGEAMTLAEEYFKSDLRDEGYAVYEEFPCENAVRGFLVHKLDDARKETGDTAAISILEEALAKFGTMPHHDALHDSTELKSVWAELVSRNLKKAGKQSAAKAVATLRALGKRLTVSPISDSTEVLAPLHLKLHDLLMSTGREKEEEGLFAEAQEDYTGANACHEDMDALGRAAICAIKRTDLDIETVRESVNKVRENVSAPIWKDLQYRYVLLLLKNGLLSDAGLIAERIRNAKLIALCESLKLQQCRADIESVNKDLELMTAGKMSLEQARGFRESLDARMAKILEYYPEYSGRKERYKDAAANAVIAAAFKEGKYVIAFEMLGKKHPDLLKNDNTFRNLAVAALGIMEDGGLTAKNYKAVIAIWLTAVYCDRLIVKSLDYTSWDDPYTFTLCDALSETWDYPDLPDNINTNDKSETNIGIGAVQRSLLERSDAVLSKGNKDYYDFYRKEIEAMDAMAAFHLDNIISEDVISPYLYTIMPVAYWNNLRAKLDDSEAALRVGVMYGITSGRFGEYSEASGSYNDCMKALSDLSLVGSHFTITKINTIRKFPNLFDQLVQKAGGSLDSLVNGGKTYSELMGPFGTICSCLQDKELSVRFLDFVLNGVIDDVKSNTISQETALPFLSAAYNVYKHHARLNENLGIVVGNLVFNYIQSGGQNTYNALTGFMKKQRAFDDRVIDAVKDYEYDSQEESSRGEQILAQLSSLAPGKSLKISQAKDNINVMMTIAKVVSGAKAKTNNLAQDLNTMYALYETHRDHDIVCLLLAQVASACIMEYVLPGKFGVSGVKKTLDKLKGNISETFKKHRKPFDDAWKSINNALSSETKQALKLGFNLNENGQRMLATLRYLKAFKTPSIFDFI